MLFKNAGSDICTFFFAALDVLIDEAWLPVGLRELAF
jgi:hypothetical protein